MKSLRQFACVLLLSTAFLACKKDKGPSTDPNATKFYGKWVGTYGYDSEMTGYFFSLLIKSDGVIQELNSSGSAKSNGTWSMHGTTLKGTYKMNFAPYSQYSVIATINAATGKMEGSWGYEGNGADGGKTLLTKH
jgi:hypothetical protein